MLKSKYHFLVLAIFMMVDFILTGNAFANDEKRTTDTGAVFTRDRSHAALGEAWRDPDGLVWGDIVKNENGSARYMVQSSEYMKEIGKSLPNRTLGAKEYCERIGARLPSREEFTRLREYMGAQSGTDRGYSPQVLPNLSDRWFWSSSVYPNVSDVAYFFYGRYGYIYNYYRKYNYAVRCVVDR